MLKSARFYFLLTFWALIYTSKVEATHLRAGDITVVRRSCSNYDYYIILHVYTRADRPVKFSFQGAGNLNFGDGSPIFHPQEVDNPPIIGQADNGPIGEVTDTVLHTFPGPGIYTVTYYEQNRNENVLNIDNSVGTPFFMQTQIVIDPFLGCDNTPQLLVPPIDQGCTGVAWFHNPGAYDIDGDSLSYEMYIPKQGAIYDADGIEISAVDVNGYQDPIAPIFYSSAKVPIPYDQANETGDGPPTFKINAVTGTLTWDAPGKAGEYNIAFIIRQWRKIGDRWVPLGYVERDMQIIIADDCKNKRPELDVPPNVCVVAGDVVSQIITAKDPPFYPGNRTIYDGHFTKIEAFSEVFTLNPSPATYTPDPPTWQITSADSTATLNFLWNTKCNHVKEQPYQVVFKATDNGRPKLATFKTWTIQVVAPAPKWVSANVNANSRSVSLAWQSYTCANAATIQIWRRVDSAPFVPPTCVTGIPDNLGYELVGEVPVNNTTYLDKKVVTGAKYCYRLLAIFPKPDGGESYVSDEICVPPIPPVKKYHTSPVITNVTVDTTDIREGQITVKWRTLFDSVKLTNVTYDVFRAEGFKGKTNLLKITPGQISDSTWVDSGLNTSEIVYNYRICAYDNTGKLIDTSAVASSVRGEAKSLFKQIQFSWSADVPWSNNAPLLTYPSHLIYRGQRSDNADIRSLGEMTLIDSVDITKNDFVYLDTGRWQNTPLSQTQNYCYAVLTRGSYGNPKIKTPLLNFSEIVCTIPSDTIPPCKPKFALTATTCSQSGDPNSPCPLDGNTGTTPFANTIKWNRYSDPSCSGDIRGYNVYSAGGIGQTFTLLAQLVTDTFYVHSVNLQSYAQCYKISAVDRAGNESELSDQFCFDNCPRYELPNVFSPNGDGCNDKFSAFSVRLYHDDPPFPCGHIADDRIRAGCARFVLGVTFTVYNRWGRQVYTYQGSSSSGEGEPGVFIDWDGKDSSGRDLDAGTYYYVANVVFNVVDPKKQNQTIKSWVQIIR